MKFPSSRQYSWVIVFLLGLAHFIQFLNYSALGILAPLIKGDLELSATQFGFLFSAIFVGAGLVQMPVGLISDRIGVRRIFSLSIGLIGLLAALFTFAPSYPAALVILFLYGLASGVITPAANKSIMDWFPPIGRATAMALKQFGGNVGSIAAGFLFPALILVFSWRKSFLWVALAQAACAPFVYRFLKEGPQKGPPPAKAAEVKALGVIFHPRILILGGATFCFMACQFCFNAYSTLFLTRELNYSVTAAGLFYSLAYAFGGGARVGWSLLSDYWMQGRRKGILILITLILLLSCSYLSLLSFYPATPGPLWAILIAFGISGIGWNAVLLTILAESLGRKLTGLATGAGFVWGFLGGLLAPPFFGYLVDVTGTYGYSWLFLAACALTILALLAFYKESRPPG